MEILIGVLSPLILSAFYIALTLYFTWLLRRNFKMAYWTKLNTDLLLSFRTMAFTQDWLTYYESEFGKGKEYKVMQEQADRIENMIEDIILRQEHLQEDFQDYKTFKRFVVSTYNKGDIFAPK